MTAAIETAPPRLFTVPNDPDEEPEALTAATAPLGAADADEAAYYGYEVLMGRDGPLGSFLFDHENGTIPIDIVTHFAYNRKFGPGAAGRPRDERLISTGTDRLIKASHIDPQAVAALFEDGRAVVTPDEYRATINGILSRADADRDPLEALTLQLMGPEPDKDSFLHRAWDNSANEAFRAAKKLIAAKEAAALIPKPRSFTLGVTQIMTPSEEDFVIGDGILTRGGKGAVYGYAGAGKTVLLNHMAACLASGKPFLGRHIIDRPHKVLFVQGELTESEIASHGRHLLGVYGNTPAPDNLVFWPHTQLGLPEGIDQLREQIVETGADVLILDPFNRFFRGQDSQKPEEVNAFFRALDALLEDPDLGVEAVIVSHHMNVAKARMIGTYGFEAWPSVILRLEPFGTGTTSLRKLTYEKIRSPGSAYMGGTAVIDLGPNGYLVSENHKPKDENQGALKVVKALESLHGEASRQDLLDAIESPERTAKLYLAHAVKLGLVEKAEKRGQRQFYRLPDPDDDDSDGFQTAFSMDADQ